MTSPPDDLPVVTVTEFEQSGQNGEWFWHTQTANGEIVGGSSGEGYKELRKAIRGFFAQQGVEPYSGLPYSGLIKVSDTVYRIEKYAV